MIRFFKMFFLLGILLLTSISVQAQISAEIRDGQMHDEELPQNIKETLAKRRIEQDQKDHDELLKRGEEALILSEQLENSFNQNNKFSQNRF